MENIKKISATAVAIPQPDIEVDIETVLKEVESLTVRVDAAQRQVQYFQEQLTAKQDLLDSMSKLGIKEVESVELAQPVLEVAADPLEVK